ncbi:CBASS oligonucleotide cyclase [Dyadobacter sediminis]|uniref:Nucleotidyltransferase n=1 Tax=Dyadobacter sediminis TaxID=1493691 RepID=A0A5R9K5Q2_9BACT|nr:CBASS oligonucleotide cyclase [Dyadobacter sediminis]TLU88978.1 nucleotidyltransferase [Dyadobacter sediminis]GGC15870.1 nucleotidyltransferase [Dyadobacter sediminis]
MKLENRQLQHFINKIKLHPENMEKYRNQVKNLKEKLEKRISEDRSNGLKVTKYIIAGSWKKHTILKPTGDNPIDIDLVLFVAGDRNIHKDLKKLYEFIIEYLTSIYPQKDISKDVDAEGNTKSVTITFSGTGLQIDIVPVVPLDDPADYVWQPSRRGGKKYITSINRQLAFSVDKRKNNPSYTSIVRAIKWWKNYKELYPTDEEPGLSSFAIELIVAHLDEQFGVQENIEEGIIRTFQFLSAPTFPIITFKNSINSVPTNFDTPIYIADNTNKENNVPRRMTDIKWKEIVDEAIDAFDTLNIAQAKNNEGDTIQEWKYIFGPTFNIK